MTVFSFSSVISLQRFLFSNTLLLLHFSPANYFLTWQQKTKKQRLFLSHSIYQLLVQWTQNLVSFPTNISNLLNSNFENKTFETKLLVHWNLLFGLFDVALRMAVIVSESCLATESSIQSSRQLYPQFRTMKCQGTIFSFYFRFSWKTIPRFYRLLSWFFPTVRHFKFITRISQMFTATLFRQFHPLKAKRTFIFCTVFFYVLILHQKFSVFFPLLASFKTQTRYSFPQWGTLVLFFFLHRLRFRVGALAFSLKAPFLILSCWLSRALFRFSCL